MPIAQITDIQPDGQPFWSNGASCDLYPFYVTFADGVSGQANSKSNPPPYRVGDSKEYTITGNHQGTNKLKVGNPKQAAPQRSSAPAPVNTRTSEVSPINGASVGMAINQATALLTRDLKREEVIARLTDPLFWEALMETASDIIRVARHLESGHLCRSVRERNAGPAQPAPRQPAPAQRPPSRPAPVEHQENMPGDEDVPF